MNKTRCLCSFAVWVHGGFKAGFLNQVGVGVDSFGPESGQKLSTRCQMFERKFDTVFTDGLSIVVGDHKAYFPLTGIMCVAVHPPKDASRPERTKRQPIAHLVAH